MTTATQTAEQYAALSALNQIEQMLGTVREHILAGEGKTAASLLFEVERLASQHRKTMQVVGLEPIDVRAAILKELSDSYLSDGDYIVGIIKSRDPRAENVPEIVYEMVREGLIKWTSRGGGHGWQLRRYKPGERPAKPGDKNLPFGHPLTRQG